ncbi:MAG: formate/nitrite transporter family protein [Lachnospiraceae bacterium]|nr:formate/nitrite transporter family protein [Lachnospiraceae bacterium]
MDLYLQAGIKKLSKSTLTLWKGAIFAGMFIALGGYASQIATMETGSKVVASCVFPVGLIMVVLTGSELFTGNNLLIIPVLAGKEDTKSLLRNLCLSWLGNGIGALFIGLCAAYIAPDEVKALLQQTAAAKMSAPVPTLFVKAILCNILVCVAVYGATTATETAGKLLAAFFPTMAFVLCGFEHSIANMYYFAGDAFLSSSFGEGVSKLMAALLHNLIPVTAGNLVGGVLIVGCGLWLASGQKWPAKA